MVIDEGPPGSLGQTAEAFGVQDRICAFLIDHEGKVHPAGKPAGGGIVGTLVSLLKGSGARDIRAVSLERPRLPVEASRAAEALFQARVKGALAGHPEGRIRGRIVDGQGRPIAGASVDASIRLLLMQSTEPEAWRNIRYCAADDRLIARSGPDGRFALSGLCKGEYVLTVESPGRAWVERPVFLAPDLQPVSVEFVLDQGDAISGQVRDPQGRPIAHCAGRAHLAATFRGRRVPV